MMGRCPGPTEGLLATFTGDHCLLTSETVIPIYQQLNLISKILDLLQNTQKSPQSRDIEHYLPSSEIQMALYPDKLYQLVDTPNSKLAETT